MTCAAAAFPLAGPGFSLIPPNNNKLPLCSLTGASAGNPHRRLLSHLTCWRSSASQGASSSPDEQDFNNASEPSLQRNMPTPGIWMRWKENSAEMSRKLAKLGISAVLAYGLFDAVTYTSFFVLAFLGYEKSTGKNPAANLQALIGIVILMWTGNNVTRPFRMAGAAALAPFIDQGLRRMQRRLNLPSVASAFALVVGVVAAVCLTVVGLLVLSRLGK